LNSFLQRRSSRVLYIGVIKYSQFSFLKFFNITYRSMAILPNLFPPRKCPTYVEQLINAENLVSVPQCHFFLVLEFPMNLKRRVALDFAKSHAYATACLKLSTTSRFGIEKETAHAWQCIWQLLVMANKIKVNKAAQKEVGVMTRNIWSLWCHHNFQSFIVFPTCNGYHFVVSRCRGSFYLELDNRSGWVEFVFMSNLNGLRISQLESNRFIKQVEKPWPEPNPFIKPLIHLICLR